MAIKDYFAKNGDVRNAVFVIACSLGLVLFATYALMGSSFLYVAPIFIIITLIGLCLKPSKLFLPFCVGLMLQFGLFSGLMGLLTVGPIMPVFVNFVVGGIGYFLLVTSLWQTIFGEWRIISGFDKFIQLISLLGFIFCIVVVAIIERHGIHS